MTGFTKLYNSILDSSIWSEDVYTRILWVTLLAAADQRGQVIAAPSRLRARANIPQKHFDQALRKLSAPDPDSRTPDNDGRRIQKIQGGWLLLNYDLYRKMRSAEERREYKRQWDEENRPSRPGRAKTRQPDKTRQSPTNPTEAEAEAEAEADKRTIVRFDYENRNLTGLTDRDFDSWREAFPAVNVKQEIKSAVQWLIDNPSKRKKQVRRFLTNWLRRAQERGGSHIVAHKPTVADHITKLKAEGRL